MIDVHSHILPSIDDGSNSIEESIEILRKAFSSGVTDIILTPHYIKDSTYNKKNTEKEILIQELREILKEKSLPVNLYLGNEVFIENDLLDLLNKEEIATLNHSKYILFELPLHNVYHGLEELVFSLVLKGYIPVLAHPERYRVFQKDPNKLVKLKEQGVLFQVNAGSFYGQYGKDAKKMVKLLWKHHMIDFLGSDIHHERDSSYKRMKKLFSKKDFQRFQENAFQLLNDGTVSSEMGKPFEKNIFKTWK